MKAGEFKAKCLELMDRVAEGQEEIIITKRGKPIAKLVALSDSPKRNLFGYMKGSVEILGDIVARLDAKWEADE
jgi:prevent-host-death family protein